MSAPDMHTIEVTLPGIPPTVPPTAVRVEVIPSRSGRTEPVADLLGDMAEFFERNPVALRLISPGTSMGRRVSATTTADMARQLVEDIACYFYGLGRESAGGDPLVFPTVLITEHPTHGRLLHYFDAGATSLDCGYDTDKGFAHEVRIVGRLSSGAHVLASAFYGAQPCGACRILHGQTAGLDDWMERIAAKAAAAKAAPGPSVLVHNVDDGTSRRVDLPHGPRYADRGGLRYSEGAPVLLGCRCGWTCSLADMADPETADAALLAHIREATHAV